MDAIRALASSSKGFFDIVGSKIYPDIVLEEADLRGKRALVTGANSGVGKEVALALARWGAEVFLLCRDQAKAAAAREEIVKRTQNERVFIEIVDMASFASEREFIRRWGKRPRDQRRIDILVSNAGEHTPHCFCAACPAAVPGLRPVLTILTPLPPKGIAVSTKCHTRDGYEISYQVNMLAHFALIIPLLQLGFMASDARIICHASSGIYASKKLDPSDLNSEDVLGGYKIGETTNFEMLWTLSARSKAQLVIFVRELQAMLAGSERWRDVSVSACHPGAVKTEIWRRADGIAYNAVVGRWAQSMIEAIGISAEQGAVTALYLATTPEGALPENRGKYWERYPSRESSPEEQTRLTDNDESKNDQVEEGSGPSKPPVTFRSLGLIKPLLEAIDRLKFTKPTDIQAAVLPLALAGRDIIGVASTGSGKTAAFALPILQKLWDEPKGLFAVVLTPTRELAYQISDQFQALGSAVGVRCAVIVGGMDMTTQAIALSKRPHIVVATPGRLHDHLENTKGFNLRYMRFLVLDEADRLLDMDFGPVIEKILRVLPKDRHTYLFSATMTSKVDKLQKASLANPARVEVNKKQDTYMVHLVNELAQNSMLIFTRTVQDAQRMSLILRKLGFPAIPLHGKMDQSARLGALNKFRSGGRNILVATDVASRGLDIPQVDIVINFDIPTYSKDYIHRVGRTARAGRAGKSITLVTQYDVELLQRIEGVVGKKMSEFVVDKEIIMLLKERVEEANAAAMAEIKDAKKGKKRRRNDDDDADGDNRDRDDDEYEAGVTKLQTARPKKVQRTGGGRKRKARR
ncbi:ribosomal RNA processing protein [Tulasnella sp. 403]|nr:ribosomal RNA processing protein [Tulasnella sp. 403]